MSIDRLLTPPDACGVCGRDDVWERIPASGDFTGSRFHVVCGNCGEPKRTVTAMGSSKVAAKSAKAKSGRRPGQVRGVGKRHARSVELTEAGRAAIGAGPALVPATAMDRRSVRHVVVRALVALPLVTRAEATIELVVDGVLQRHCVRLYDDGYATVVGLFDEANSVDEDARLLELQDSPATLDDAVRAALDEVLGSHRMKFEKVPDVYLRKPGGGGR